MLVSKGPAGGRKWSDFEEIGLDVEPVAAGSAGELVGEEHLEKSKKDVVAECWQEEEAVVAIVEERSEKRKMDVAVEC